MHSSIHLSIAIFGQALNGRCQSRTNYSWPSALTSRTVGLDRSELDSDCVSRIGRMLQRVSVSASAAVLLPTASEGAANEAKPEIRGEAATFVGARSETCEILRLQH